MRRKSANKKKESRRGHRHTASVRSRHESGRREVFFDDTPIADAATTFGLETTTLTIEETRSTGSGYVQKPLLAGVGATDFAIDNSLTIAAATMTTKTENGHGPATAVPVQVTNDKKAHQVVG